MSNESSAGGGIGCFTVMFLIFLTLKLYDKIDWSWWWVTAPLWGPPALIVGVVGTVAVVAGIVLGVIALVAWLKN